MIWSSVTPASLISPGVELWVAERDEVVISGYLVNCASGGLGLVAVGKRQPTPPDVVDALLSGRIPELLDRYGIADHVARVTTSEEVGYTKPDRRMFDTALSKTDVQYLTKHFG